MRNLVRDKCVVSALLVRHFRGELRVLVVASMPCHKSTANLQKKYDMCNTCNKKTFFFLKYLVVSKKSSIFAP